MANSQTILIALKGILKTKGITYSKIANLLGLNETSVKRMMSGQTSMTLERLDEICELIGIDAFELFRLAKSSPRSEPDLLLLEQEQALAESEYLFLTFYSLAKGLTLKDILKKYRINEEQLQKSLLNLDKLNLIALLPKNQIKFLASRGVRWREDGPLSQKYEKQLESDFLNSSFSKAEEWRKFLSLPLSERSKTQFIRKLRSLLSELQSQSEMDLILDKNLKTTATVLIGLRQWTPQLLAKHLK